MEKFDKPKWETTQRGSVMQGMFPYPVFSREVRKYLDQTASGSSRKCYSDPKTKSSFQNLKFRPIHIYELCLGIFVQSGPPLTLPRYLRRPQNVRNNGVRSDAVELCLGAQGQPMAKHRQRYVAHVIRRCEYSSTNCGECF